LAKLRASVLKPFRFGVGRWKLFRFGIWTPSTLRRRPERAAITAAAATPASAAVPAASGTAAFRATVAAPCAAFCAPWVTVAVARLPLLRLLRGVERGRLLRGEELGQMATAIQRAAESSKISK
jgi:hypothetical protein